MSRRKTICYLTSIPESQHAHRIAAGIFGQCEKYGYNIAVFASMIPFDFYFKDYAEGEKKIYQLANYRKFDGIILDNISLIYSNNTEVAEDICKRIREQTNVPVIGIGIPIDDIPVVKNRNDDMLRELCRHAIGFHGCKKICILTGMKGNHEAEERLAVLLDETKRLGAEVADEHIIYGDFWYTSGKKLGEDIAAGRISKPDAVISASDHMALGLIEELKTSGIRVPDDIRVLGFEASPEAVLNDITLTSVESNFRKCGADAVDEIRKLIEPDKNIIPYVPDVKKMLYTGSSCGCESDVERTMEQIRTQLYLFTRNYAKDVFKDNIDIGLLMENYIQEQLTAAQTPEECIEKIGNFTYIIAPFENFYLCLREDWLDIDSPSENNYPDRMKLVLARSNGSGENYYGLNGARVFETAEMLPAMFEEHDEPFAYYFSAVHFMDKTLGYAVLQRKLSDSQKFNLVYRNWLRFTNNALEMVRSKNRLVEMSFHDKMTGLLNRRGMYAEYERISRSVTADDHVFVCVIDMDGLKYINDTFGHQEGDLAISSVSRAVSGITDGNEICVRAGGDEFFIVGTGKYTENVREEKSSRFYELLDEYNKMSARKKPYAVSASMGFAVRKASEGTQLDELILEADEAMYRNKMLRKKERYNT